MMHLRLMMTLKKPSSLRHIRSFSIYKYIDILPEVSSALNCKAPIVALESTIMTHGMPYPQNYEVALSVQEIIREQGATPATIAIIGGRIKVGLEENAMKELAARETSAVKTSRRDFPYVISKGLDGGTTVSGTIIVANAMGIDIFATGGIGGVHRSGEVTMDVSTDLTELGRNPVAVVSSGVKSILDIPRTLEYLETQGVCVATYGSSTDFPSFYSRYSLSQSPYNVETPVEAAMLVHSLRELDLKSGLLLAVPVPEEKAMPENEIEAAIQQAIIETESQGIFGKDVTPYVLSRVNDLTSGRSLEANIALIQNNGRVAAQIAVELQKFKNREILPPITPNYENMGISSGKPETARGAPVVIGGSVLDSTAAVKEDSIQISKPLLAAFDFDLTLINDVSLEVLLHLGFPDVKLDELNAEFMLTADPPKVMQRIVRSLQNIGFTPKDFYEAMQKIPVTPGLDEVLKKLKQNNCEIIVISDNFTVPIRDWLSGREYGSLVDEVFSNPCWYDSQGCLVVEPYHKNNSCNLGFKSLCKGRVLETYLKKRRTQGVSFKRVAFFGDGNNDLCPMLRLTKEDLAFPRKGMMLADAIQACENENVKQLKAPVYPWSNGSDILQVLSKIVFKNKNDSIESKT